MDFKEYFKDTRFLLTLANAILCSIIVALLGLSLIDYKTSPRGIEVLLLAHAGPVYLIIQWGFIISYLLGVQPPTELQLIYAVIGACIFTTVGVFQLNNIKGKCEKREILLILLHFLGATSFLNVISQWTANKRLKKVNIHPYIVYMSPEGFSLQKAMKINSRSTKDYDYTITSARKL